MIVYDITNQKVRRNYNNLKSFENIESWKNEFILQGGVKDPKKFPFVIVGNKCDRESERKVQKSKAEMWCQNNGELQFFETSAKNDVQVKDAFQIITALAADQVKEEEIYIPPTIDLNKAKKPKNRQSNGCC